MKIIKALLLSILSFGSVLAFASQKADAGTVPFNLDHNRIIIKVGVYLPSGVIKQVNAWVDNGTPSLSITRRLAKELGLISTADSMKAKAPGKIQIGRMQVVVHDIREPVEIADGTTVGSGLAAEINLPAAVLCNYDVLIDYPARQFTIGPPGTVQFSGTEIKGFFNPKNHLIQLPANIDGQAFNLALDAGTPVSFISGDLVSKWSKAHHSWPRVRGAIGIANLWGLDDEPDWQLLRVSKMLYGGISFPGAIVVSFPAGRLDYFQNRAGISTAGLMGAASMLNYRIGIDYAHSKVYFQQISKPIEPDMSLVGLTLRPESDGRYSVLGIARSGGKPAMHGVLKGDILLKVNNKAINGLTMGQVWSLLSGKTGTIF
jgi:hypothetical protein